MRIKDLGELWQHRWHLYLLGLLALTAVVGVMALFIGPMVGSFYTLIFLVSSAFIFVIVMIALEVLKTLKSQDSSLSDIRRQNLQNTAVLEQVLNNIRLSETAKTIAYRDMDRMQLRETVMEKLHQADFEATYAMVDDIGRRPEYKQLADELKELADEYKNSTDNERFSKVVKYIDRLIEQHQWTVAAVQAERLIKTHPDLEQANQVRQKIIEKKELRKRQLLAEWDEAVKKEDTDRSLRILSELDMYLTPSEGLALQEAASQVFKNKLHNMGVQFSLAVTDKHWPQALQCANEIVKDFPNSKMAHEIRVKYSILKELAGNS